MTDNERLEATKANHVLLSEGDAELARLMSIHGYGRAIQIACNEWELMMQREYGISAHMRLWLRSMAETIDERGFA